MADGVQAFYGRWASVYDRLATLGVVGDWRQRTVDALAPAAGDTVVEMGCGTGANLPALRRRVGDDGTVVGLDVTRGMLERANDRRRGDAALLQADATRPPLAGDVDAMLATFVVGLFPEAGAVVDTWCDHLAPGGRVALLHFHATDASWGAVANLGYRGLVRLASPDPIRTAGAAALHDARVRDAHDALRDRGVSVECETFAGGFLRLVVGQLPE